MSVLRVKIRACTTAVVLVFAGTAQGQIVLDGRLGPAGPIAPVGGNYAILNTLGTQVGGNLFHSFTTFNLATGNMATFSGTPGTANIVARVTGGSGSSIDGTMRSTIAGANLWFINPWGVTFGPNAQLDVSGAFHASTASHLTLGSGPGAGRFDAVNPSASNLVAAAPSAFGFLGNPAPLVVNGATLAVAEGKDLTLAGGSMSLSNATLRAPGGRLALASAGGAGEFGVATLTPSAGTSTADLTIRGGVISTETPTSSTTDAGPIYIRAGRLTLDGGRVVASTDNGGAGGTVTVSAGDLVIAGGGRIESKAIFNLLSTPGTGAGGEIAIDATGGVTITGAGSGLFTGTTTYGDGGRIRVRAQNILLSNGARIAADSTDPYEISDTLAGTILNGRSGSIDLEAAGSIRLHNAVVSTSAETSGGGAITIRAVDTLAVIDSTISTSVHGRFLASSGGSITIDPIFTILNNGSIITNAVVGNGGPVSITTQFFMMSPDSLIDTSSTFGQAGTLTINSPNTDTVSELGALPGGYFDASALLRESCAARAGRGANSFVGTGRGGLPAGPGGLAFANYAIPAATTAAAPQPLLYASLPSACVR